MASRFKIRSEEKPVGCFDKRFAVLTNRPATKRMRKQKATCTAIRACIKRLREWGSSPPFNAEAGSTEEARKAAGRPNRNVTPRASANAKPSTRQSAERASWESIMPTTSGADHQANAAPARVARNASN